MELKVTIKFSINFLQMILKYTLSLAMSFFLKELATSGYFFIIIKNVGSPFFVKFFFQNQLAIGFP